MTPQPTLNDLGSVRSRTSLWSWRTGFAPLIFVVLLAVFSSSVLAQKAETRKTSVTSGERTSAETSTSEAASPSEEGMQPPSWTPEFSLRFRDIRDTALSANGSLVAYTVREALTEGEKSEFVDRIWVAATDGSWDRQYTRGEHSATSPQFSPDGEWLAFLAKRESGEDAKAQVWRLAVGGGEAAALTKSPSGVNSFAFSPDGKSLAFLASDPETEDEKKAKKEKRDPILVDRDHKYSHLYVLDVPTDDDSPASTDALARRLTEGDFEVTSFDWSPDGRTLVFAHQRDPNINTGMVDGDLSVVSADGGAVRTLVAGGGVEGSPLYSPDGRWIAFTGSGERAEPVGLDDVFVIPTAATGAAVRRLALTHDRSARLVAWRPDSNSVIAAESIGTTNHLVEIPIEGSDDTVPRVVAEPKPANGSALAGVMGAQSMSRDGKVVAFTIETPDTPVELYTSSTVNFAPRRLSSINSHLELPPMGRTEVVRWTSKDGGAVEGLITYPVGYQAGRRVPLILNVHGGPAGVFSQGFTGDASIYLLQYFAEKGYAILRPNPRGSTGYGKDFRFSNVRDWGFGDYEDLMSGVDWAVARGVADPDRLFLMGWSYGGYMTSFAITRTDRFKAASMGAGLPNLVSMVHTTDIPDYLAAHQGAELWDDLEEYEKHSAMYHLDKVTTPTQILHGMNDLRVPFDQGRELYIGLQRRGIPTEMIAYPRTPHGPREPKLLIDVSPRILLWFERWMPRGSDGEEPTSRP